jgi:uncharacterized membrane protein YciS (DUF1049 family)
MRQEPTTKEHDMEQIIIRSEDEALDLLRQLVEGYRFEESFEVRFDDWPRFVIQISGADFHGTIPTRIMPTMLELQREVHRMYCLATYGDENVRRLTKKDREQLELLVKVDEGSSVFESLLAESMSKIFEEALSRMSPEQLTAVLIVFGLSVTSLFFWKFWLNNRLKEKELEQTVQLSALEKEKMEIVRQASLKFPLTDAAAASMDPVRTELLTRLRPADSLAVKAITEPGKEVAAPVSITGELAEQVVHVQREASIERLVEDEFFLRSADFSRPDGVRIVVQRIADGYSFPADVPLGVLGHDQAEAIKNDSWNKKSLRLGILVKELRGNYTSAKVVSVRQMQD